MKNIINHKKVEVNFENNQKLWQTTLDAMSESVFLIDLDHKILQCNKATLDILGKSSYNEIIGHSCWELLHGTSGPVGWCPVEHMKETRKREATVQKINDKWVEISAEPVLNDDGEITGAVHIITDISSRKKVEDALKESEQQYLTILNSLSDAMHVVDKNLRIIYQNPAMIQWLEKINLNSDNIGKTVFQSFPFLDYDKIYNEYDNVFKTKEFLITTDATKVFDRNYFTETLKIPIRKEGEVSHIITILRDVTEQKEAEEKLRTSEEKYKNIISNLIDIIIILDLKGHFQYISPQVYDISGFSPEEIIGKSGFKFMHPDDIKNAANVLKEAIDKKKRMYIEYRTIHKDGYYIDVSASGRIVNLDGEDRIFAVVRDITDQKRSERKLKESEAKYRLITENANDMIAILNNKMEYDYVNEIAFQNIMGRTRGDLIGVNALRWVHPDDVNKCLNAFKEGWEKGESNIQARFKDTYDKYHWLDVKGKTIIDQKGEKKVLLVSRDISERKEYEQRLKLSEEKYRYLIENALEGVWVIDSNANTSLVNPSMAKIMGYNVEEMVGKSLFAFMDDEAAKITRIHLEKRKKGISEERDAEFLHKSGSKVYLRIRATPIFDNDGNYDGTYAFLVDITQNMLAEQKLKESEERFRILFEIAPASIVVLDLKGNIILSNQKFCNLHGVKNSELLEGRKILEFIAKKDWSKLKEAMKKSIEGLPRGLNQYAMLKDDGTEFLAEAISSGIKNKNGEIIGLILVAQDITERNNADQQLKESEEKFRTIAEQSFMGIIILQDGVFKYFNEKAAKINGYSMEEIQNWKPYEFQKLIYPKDKEFVMEQVRKKQAGDPEVVINYQYRIVKKNREVIWVDNYSKTINYKGKPADFVMTIDINEKIKAEEKLKDSEEKYRLISENTDDLIVVYSENGIVEYLNVETHSRVLGYSPEKLVDKTFRDTLVHEDDREIAKIMSKEGIKKGNYYYQFRLKHQNGKYYWFEVTGKIFTDSNRNKKILCVSRNIDEKKSAEYKIKESEENFRTIAEQAFVGTLIIQDDKVEYVNSALLQIFEFSHEEIDNWKKNDLLKLIYPEDLQYLREYRQNLRDSEFDMKPYYSYRVFTKYGKIKWIDQFSRPIIYREKPAEIITIMDITEKKKAEQELINLNSLKSELLRRTSHELKTPLVSIKGFSDLLLTVHKEKLDDYVLATIHEIRLGCERLENLIQDILKTSELESESVNLKKSEEDLSFLIKLCVKELQGLIKLRNHEISLEIHDKLITAFEPDQLHLVISNLLNNAIKYTPPNGKIEIRSAITDDNILISIQDNGIGITNEEKKRLFSQFGKIERYGQGLDIISDGSGLGLFITKKIIELHDGKIGVRSKGRNKGSTFYFTLPLCIENKE